MAWAARRAGINKVTAFAQDHRDAFRAAKAGAISEIARDPECVVRASSLVVIAGTGSEIAAVLDLVAAAVRKRGVITTDLASPKRVAARAAERLELAEHFAGSAPVVSPGTEDMGGASPDLLRDAIVYVTPLPDGDRAAAEVADFWHRVIGAHPVMIDAERYDAQVAWTAQLPQVVASALAVALGQYGPSGVTHRTSTLDATRLAVGDAERIAAVLLENRDHVRDSLEAFGNAVESVRRALSQGDTAGVAAWIEAGAAWRRRFDP